MNKNEPSLRAQMIIAPAIIIFVIDRTLNNEAK